MLFIILTLSFTAAILLSGVLSFVIVTHPKVMNWYMKWVVKKTEEMTNMMFKED